MAKFYSKITTELQEFIQEQNIFFTGTAAQDGTVNVSPKGLDSLRILNGNKLVWLNLTGSGNETAAHIKLHNRLTLMFCAFEGKPLILRLYGKAKILHPRDEGFQEYLELFPKTLGTRQFIEMDVDRVQTSCGYAVPLMDFKENRDTLTKWSEHKGAEKIREYWKEKNQKSIDDFDTGIFG